MARRYHEPVEVRRGLVAGAEAPAEFLWRDRLFVVRDVLSHWVETGSWWASAALAGVYGLDAEPATPGGPAGPGESVDAGLGGDGERELWRVEAGAGRGGLSGVFDLSLDSTTGQWLLRRSHD